MIIVIAISAAIVGFLIAGSSALLIDELVRTTKSGAVSSTLALLIVFAIGSMALPDIISFFREYIERKFWLRLGSHIDVLFLRARLNVDIATFERPSFRDTLGKATDRGIYPIMNVLDSQHVMLADIIMLMIASVILAQYDLRYLAILLVGAIPRLIIGMRFGKEAWSIYDMNAEDRRRFYFLRNFPDESERLMEAHLLRLQGSFVERLRGLVYSFLAIQLVTEKKKAVATFGALMFSVVTIAIAYAMVINAVVAGTISIGAFFFVSAALSRFADPLQRIFVSLGRQYEHSLFAREIFVVMDTVPSISLPSQPQPVSHTTAPEIIFEHVRFRYPNATKDVFSDLSITLPAGTSLALVGINGAGKTTLVKLLCRFYDPTEGRILINGVDLKEIDLGDWYRALAVLFQHFPLYRSFTAGESIALGNVEEKEDTAAILRSAKDAGADEIIDAWEKGYAQMLGKEFTGGVDPSRGQEQRLALARMFYRDAGCLILDEPTASVDAESEEHIFRAIEHMQGKTRLLISHRFSTVRNANQICVLDDGAVRELGTHTELMKAGGEYARLFQLQAAGYAKNSPESIAPDTPKRSSAKRLKVVRTV
jgi:ATP-binding cassette subfamily B protein